MTFLINFRIILGKNAKPLTHPTTRDTRFNGVRIRNFHWQIQHDFGSNYIKAQKSRITYI